MNKYTDILIQGFSGLLLSLVIILLFRILGREGFEWEVSLVILTVYVVINPFLVRSNHDQKTYFLISFVFAFALAFDLIILTTLITKTKLSVLPQRSLLFLFPIMFHPVSVIFSWLINYFKQDQNPEKKD